MAEGLVGLIVGAVVDVEEEVVDEVVLLLLLLLVVLEEKPRLAVKLATF